jgi:hypothetical protein
MRTPCSQQRTHEIQDTIFGEHVPFSFFYSREKILCVGFLFYFLVRDKKGFENTLFEIRMVVKTPPSRTNIYIYNIYIYRKGKKETP